MAHFFYFPPPIPSDFFAKERMQSMPLPPPPQTLIDISDSDQSMGSSNRSDSLSSNGFQSQAHPGHHPPRRNSALATHRNPGMYNAGSTNVRTRGIRGFGNSGVVFERDTPPTDDDVIIVTVRLSNNFRKSSIDGASDLPSRYFFPFPLLPIHLFPLTSPQTSGPLVLSPSLNSYERPLGHRR